MKKYIVLLGLILSLVAPSYGQMTLAHTFPGANYQAEVVNLSHSGKKIAVINSDDSTTTDIYYYNTL